MSHNVPSSSAHAAASLWPADVNPPRVGYLSRKALPIKRNDAEPLTREDVQYDLLHYLFSNKQTVFTNPTSPTGPKLTFGDLYAAAIYHSAKCSKVLKDKMSDNPAFNLEFSKFSLLTNIGRINTTMAFFPEMKTALRTYHPVPSLQKTDGNAQDAPRIKNCLKAALLPSEIKAPPPSSPEEVLSKQKAGQRPATSVVNLIFVLANHAAPLASVHFDGTFNFLDLFLPNTGFASADRGRALLWLLYYYLESSEPPNPFDDHHSIRNPNKIPYLRQLSQTELDQENVDTQEEIHWGHAMSNQRNHFLQKLVSSLEVEKRAKASAPHFVTETGNNLPRSQRQLQEVPKDEASFLFYVPSREHHHLPPRPQHHMHHMVPMCRKLLQLNSMFLICIRRLDPPPPHRMMSGERTMFQQAWHVATSVDPLVDSDDELMLDHHNVLDLSRRLNVITRIQRHVQSPP